MPTNDLYKTVNYNDGEGLTHTDQNDSQRFLAARLNDQILGRLIGGPTNKDPEFVSQQGADPSASWAYCLSVGGANPRQGSANNKVKIGAGTLFQKISAADGNEPQLLAYTFDGTLEFTLSNGHATLPRVDMIQMKLDYVTDDPQSRDFQDATTHVVTTTSMNKKRQVEATVSVKTGTPNATPVYPTPDSGYVPIACVVVGETYTGTNPLNYIDVVSSGEAVLHDLRMPIRIVPRTTLSTDLMIDPMPAILFVTTLDSTDTPAGAPGGTHVRDANKWILAASATPVYYPLTGLQDGDVFMWQLDVEKNTNGSATITGKVVYTTISGETDAETAVTDNSNAPGAINFSNSTKITVVDGRMYYFKFIPSASVTPAADRIGILKVKYRRFGANAHAMATCTSRAGRLISLAVTSANGSHTANTGRLTLNNAYQNNYGIGNLYYLADVSTVAETTGTPKTNGLTMATIESNAKFIAGPTITGNGTHSPPIWTNGKRCYDESLNIGSGVATPYKLGIRFESSTGIDLFDTTFYVAEGI